MRTSHASIFWLLLVAAALPVCAESVHLTLSCAEKVGAKSEIVTRTSDHIARTLTLTGRPAETVDSREILTLEATREVLATSPDGKATKARFTVKSLTLTRLPADAASDLLESGSEIVSELRGDQVIHTVNGQAPTPELVKSLNLVIELSANHQSDPDTMFRTGCVRPVGKDWDCDMDEVVKVAGSWGPTAFDEAAASCKARIEKLVTVNGVQCAQFKSEFKLKPTAIAGLPAGTRLSNAALKLTVSGPVPLNPGDPDPAGRISAEIGFKANFPTPEGSGSLVFKRVWSREESFRVVK